MNILSWNWMRSFIALVISSLIVVLLFSKIDAQQVWHAVGTSSLGWLALAALISLSVNIFLGAAKWQRILRVLGCFLPYREVLAIRSGCLPLKVVFPLKTSELFKVLYLERKKKIAFVRAASSLLLDKSLNLLVTVGIFLVGLSVVKIAFSSWIPLAALLTLLIFLFCDRVRNLLMVIPGRIHPRVHQFAQGLFSGFTEASVREKLILICYSLVYQFSEFVNTYILFKAVGLSVPFSLVLVLVPLIMVINNFPVTVLGLGTREALIIFLFAKYGTPALLLSAGLLVSFIEHVLPVAFGLFFLKTFISHKD